MNQNAPTGEVDAIMKHFIRLFHAHGIEMNTKELLIITDALRKMAANHFAAGLEYGIKLNKGEV